ncbi:DUF4374 domain-containing protein [Flavobacterium hercynium]|uniref:DUF4374 domain-containing protein n=1 Tax=Flavobacterium hercynium TaxID=387094 RepID=A0A226HFL2_9FLAO|nr:DUF4374 domain-containing protein [Flavobacterium hercynium]OXA92942.1 hypothetical protein B0A66_09255 [Flavobacterium hercynium]SMP03486.1 protein of unknown function [Flavobacterium hercynium]
MRTIKIKNLLALMLMSVTIFSCSSDDAAEPEVVTPDPQPVVVSKYVLGYQTDTWNENYLWSFSSLDEIMTGTIDMNGKGIEQGGSYIPVANTLFALDSEAEGAAPYSLNAASQVVAGTRVLIESPFAYGETDDNKLLIIGASWGGSTSSSELIIYDPVKQLITGRKFDDFATSAGRFDFPTGVTVVGDKVFVTVFNRDASENWDIDQTNAYVRVYDYPSLNFVKRIADPRTTAAGMYYTNTGIIRTESGNVYTFSSNAKAGGYSNPSTTINSGILRINKGQTDFDASYFFDIQASSLGGKVLAAYPIGGEKAFIVYIPTADDTLEWGFLRHYSFAFKSAIIDLPTKKITPVTGLPGHAGDNYFGIGSLYYEAGNAYKAFVTNDEVRIYKINLETGAATAGAKVTGGGTDISAIAKLTHTTPAATK